MSKKGVWLLWLGALAAITGLALAADHFDSPLASKDARKDITDVYAFRSPANSDNLVVALNVSPHAPGYASSPLFSNEARYNIHVDNNGDLTADATVMVTFSGSSPQTFSVTGLAPQPITGQVTAAGAAPVIVTSGAIQVFCGPREDPFFFDLVGFKAFVSGPYLPAAGLRSSTGGTPKDFFAGNNVGSIVIELPITALTGQATSNTGVIKAWATVTEPQ